MESLTPSDIKPFDECVKEPGRNRHLLLGNGFSISLFPDKFRYARLADKISDERILNIFKDFGNSNFEYILLKLVESLKVVNHYEEAQKLSELIKKDADKLKKLLIEIIAQSHPPAPSEITSNQYESCREFLLNFGINKKNGGKIYTLNYDLLLYWVFMHFWKYLDKRLVMTDGFGYGSNERQILTWEIGRAHTQNLNYVHGAMHLFRTEDGKLEKYFWGNSENMSITEQVKWSITNDRLPVFISEGSSDYKLNRIMDNGYLARTFSSFKSIGGDLFIFGHSLGAEDDHIFKAMNENKLKRIYVSIYGDGNSDDNHNLIHRVNLWKYIYPQKEYILYQAETARVWDKFDL